MQNFKDAGFIKSYPALLKLPIKLSEKSLLELILSFTDNKNTFYMNYKDIAQYLGFSNVQSVTNAVSSLRKKGYITTKQSHNFNGSTGGSSTSMVVNEDLINLQLKSIIHEENQAIASDLNDNIAPHGVVVVSTKITDEIADKSLEYDFDKMVVLCEQSDVIKKLATDFIPKDADFVIDEDFRIAFANHLKSVFKNVVLAREDFKGLYRDIELEETETES